MASDLHVIQLDLPSTFELLDLVQLLCDRLSEIAGLDDDGTHWVSVAVRESVINAIKHGNREDAAKHVIVRFSLGPRANPDRLDVEVLDQGEGFDPEEVANPLDPENLLKSSGRGIFFPAERFPLFSLGGALRDMGVGLEAGTGGATTVDDDEEVLIDGGGAAYVSATVFWEGLELWRIRSGPFVGVHYMWSDTVRRPMGLVGFRTTLYTGP